MEVGNATFFFFQKFKDENKILKLEMKNEVCTKFMNIINILT